MKEDLINALLLRLLHPHTPPAAPPAAGAAPARASNGASAAQAGCSMLTPSGVQLLQQVAPDVAQLVGAVQQQQDTAAAGAGNVSLQQLASCKVSFGWLDRH